MLSLVFATVAFFIAVFIPVIEIIILAAIVSAPFYLYKLVRKLV